MSLSRKPFRMIDDMLIGPVILDDHMIGQNYLDFLQYGLPEKPEDVLWLHWFLCTCRVTELRLRYTRLVIHLVGGPEEAAETCRRNPVIRLFIKLDEEWSVQKKSGYTRRTAWSHNGGYRPNKGASLQYPDVQHAMSSHELQGTLMLTVEFSKVCFIM